MTYRFYWLLVFFFLIFAHPSLRYLLFSGSFFLIHDWRLGSKREQKCPVASRWFLIEREETCSFTCRPITFCRRLVQSRRAALAVKRASSFYVASDFFCGKRYYGSFHEPYCRFPDFPDGVLFYLDEAVDDNFIRIVAVGNYSWWLLLGTYSCRWQFSQHLLGY